MPSGSIAMQVSALFFVVAGASLVAATIIPALRRVAVKLTVVAVVIAVAAGLIR